MTQTLTGCVRSWASVLTPATAKYDSAAEDDDEEDDDESPERADAWKDAEDAWPR